eukprot:13695768-Alexandrium_andersonii.AAC.1
MVFGFCAPAGEPEERPPSERQVRVDGTTTLACAISQGACCLASCPPSASASLLVVHSWMRVLQPASLMRI